MSIRRPTLVLGLVVAAAAGVLIALLDVNFAYTILLALGATFLIGTVALAAEAPHLRSQLLPEASAYEVEGVTVEQELDKLRALHAPDALVFATARGNPQSRRNALRVGLRDEARKPAVPKLPKSGFGQ